MLLTINLVALIVIGLINATIATLILFKMVRLQDAKDIYERVQDNTVLLNELCELLKQSSSSVKSLNSPILTPLKDFDDLGGIASYVVTAPAPTNGNGHQPELIKVEESQPAVNSGNGSKPQKPEKTAEQKKAWGRKLFEAKKAKQAAKEAEAQAINTQEVKS